MNIFDLLESPRMGRPRDTNGVQSAADQSAASVIGSGTTKREDKKKPVTMMGVAVKEGFDIGGIKNWLLKLKQGLSTEAEETKAMFDTYVRYTQGQASEQEMNTANEQFKDLLRGLGMGTLAAMPGSVVTLPLVFKLAKKFNIELMPSAFKNDVEEAAVKSNFKMPPESLQDKMYRQHQELRKQRGAPSAEEYKQRIAQKQKEIDDLKEGILDRAIPKMPKPRNPADQVLRGKVNAGGRHLDKKRRQELAPKHKHQDPLEEGWKDAVAGAALAGSLALGGMAHAAEPVVGQGQSQNMQMAVDMAKHNARVKYLKTVHGDNFQDKQMPEHRYGKLELKPNDKGGYIATVPLIVDTETQNESLRPGERHHFETDPVTGKRVYKGIRGDQQDEPQRAKDDPAARADQERRAHIAHDRGLTEQAVKITDYDTWSDKVKALGGEIHPQKDRNLLVAQSWDGEEIGKFHLGKSMGFINQQGVAEAEIPSIYSKQVPPDMEHRARYKCPNCGIANKVQDWAANDNECPTCLEPLPHGLNQMPLKYQGVEEGWKGKVAGAALAGAAALGGGDVDAQNIDLPGPQVSYIAHVSAEANGREIHRSLNLGTKYSSEQEAYDDIERSLQAKGITRYNINIEQKYDTQYYPGSNQPRGGSATGRDYGTPGIGDMVIKHIGREIRAGIPDRGGYATGGTNQGQRPRDGSQWWKDQLPRIKEDELAEDIESHLYLMSRAGYDIVQEEWSDKYKDSINCSNPKGFSQKAHCAGKKKNEGVAEGLTETRNSLFAFVKQQFPAWPDYIVKDFLYQQAKTIDNREQMDDWLQMTKNDFGKVTWKLEKLPITLDIFTPKTQRMIKSREGGNSNPFKVRKDAERHAQQLKMIQQQGIRTEPIIVAKLENGYDLIEGWHRTIQHLKAYPEGYTGPAWVGYGATYKSESVEQGVAEEKVRLDPKCWSGKKIGNPKTKMKGGVRVNNCVPK
jgi:hypothetical protein